MERAIGAAVRSETGAERLETFSQGGAAPLKEGIGRTAHPVWGATIRSAPSTCPNG
jgi:hypothetical protein